MRPITVAAMLLGVGGFIAGCTTSQEGRRIQGSDGPIEWEVVDVGRIESRDKTRMRWSYTIVFREKAGVPVQFEQIIRSAYAHTLATGGIARFDFVRRLDAHSELRYHTSDAWGYVSSANRQFGGITELGSLTVERRFVGKNARGETVTAPVRVVLDRGFGRRSRQPDASHSRTPPEKHLSDDDVKTLTGGWDGYYDSGEYLIPIRATVRDDGFMEIAENDPATNRFRASLSIKDGRVLYSGRTSGDFSYHEDVRSQVLVGRIALPAPETGASHIRVRLEREAGR